MTNGSLEEAGSSGQGALQGGFTTDLAIKTFSQGSAYIGKATTQNNWTIEDLDVEAFQLVFGNHEATARTIFSAKVAFAWGIAADGITPLDAAGQPDNTLWQTVVGATNLTVAAGGGTGSPNLTRAYTPSGWQAARSVGSGLRIFMVRVFGLIDYYASHPSYAPGTGDFEANGVPGQGEWSRVDQGRHITSCYKYVQDGVRDPGTWKGVSFFDGFCPAAIMLRSRKPGIAFMAAGDSLVQGYRTTADHNSWGFKACCMASTHAVPCTFINLGVSGSTSRNFLQEGLTGLKAFRPSVAMIPAFSANDHPTTQADFDRMFDQMLVFIKACQVQGTVPILWTGIPCFTSGAAQTLAAATAKRCLDYAAAHGLRCADSYRVIDDPGHPNTERPAYDFGDHHPNDSATTAIAREVYRTCLAPLLADHR